MAVHMQDIGAVLGAAPVACHVDAVQYAVGDQGFVDDHPGRRHIGAKLIDNRLDIVCHCLLPCRYAAAGGLRAENGHGRRKTGS
ncbi:hypothetical protein MKFW12EY_31750 [Methylomonas koyamae]|nr:hypothetical protein MKFW12EY_31750 [Methylomonas koyamae]